MALQRYSKYKELTILYERKGLHKKALDLLKMMSTQSSSLLAGPKPTVDYLKHLGADHLKLIFEYADWVIQRHPSDGLEIFSDDFRYKTGHLPKDKVVAYLESKDETLAILYLELQNENESTRKLEHTLIDKYIERAQALISDKFNAIRDRRTDPAHVSDQDELDVLRRFSLLRKAVGLKENLDDDDV
ncbi:Vam6/Vps39-like protein [Halotydeus destructor]|nr:Vam6/Vps39-like protein [Halotydeus destructor]